MAVTSILWRRLDTPGHDACNLDGNEVGWTLDGMAVFVQDRVPAQLAYHVECDLKWRTRQGWVRGFVGVKAANFTVVRTTAGTWTLNGAFVPGLDDCVDLDLGFTPATNLLAVRRLDLAEGQAAATPGAWLDVFAGTLQILPQLYERRSQSTYWYEASSVPFEALLDVTPIGFIRRYPGLWEAES
jgi:uncharacterized protein